MTDATPSCTELKNDLQVVRASAVCETLRRTRPRTRKDLRNYLKVFLNIDVPDKKMCPEHSSPLDYLWYSFATDFGFQTAGRESASRPAIANADAIVWANRAGGKTELAAVATLLDGLFKPNCQIRILGGSGEQSGRMYNYLTTFLQKGFETLVAGPIRKESCHFITGATVEVLTQSTTSVRGQHVQ
jgi:hypothetical protein